MIDIILDIGASFDWLSPTIAFAQDFLNGPAADFGIPSNAGFARGDIKRLLKKHGVRVWGLMLNPGGDMLMFSVPKSQAAWAYYLLQREGVPVLYAPVEVTGEVKRRSVWGYLLGW